MERNTDTAEMLDLIVEPVFCVKDGLIVKCNEAAARLFLREGIPVSQVLEAGAEDYACYTGGMLYVTLSIYGQNWGASVSRVGDLDVFSMDQQFDSEELQVLALAARELRTPLASAMLAAHQVADSPAASRLNRGLNQLLRIIGNMSDASGCGIPSRKTLHNADALFGEIIEKAAALTEKNGTAIRYEGLGKEILFPADRQQLERAALNMLANAIKFSKSGSCITASLHQSGKLLRFSVADSGCGIPEAISGTLFRRYLREPVIEDTRYGIGLGMLMMRNAAAAHGGAVLVDHPKDGGTRVTLTLSTDIPAAGTLRSPLLNIDYAGELDHALLELSEVLPAELY